MIKKEVILMETIAEMAILDPAVNLWNSVVSYLPGLLAALLTIVIGYFIGLFVGLVVRKGLEHTKLQKWLVKTGRADSLGGLDAPYILGALVKWWIFIAFLSPAASLINLGELSMMLNSVASWLPHLLAAVIIMIVGMVLADFAEDKVLKAKKVKGIKLIGSIVKIVIIIFFLSIALKEIGIQIALAETTLLIILSGIVLALSLAIGIGFGLGIRKHADKIMSKMLKKL